MGYSDVTMVRASQRYDHILKLNRTDTLTLLYALLVLMWAFYSSPRRTCTICAGRWFHSEFFSLNPASLSGVMGAAIFENPVSGYRCFLKALSKKQNLRFIRLHIVMKKLCKTLYKQDN